MAVSGKGRDMLEIDEKVTLKKQHPCGSREWRIARIGADIKLQCLGCGRYVNVSRDALKKGLVKTDGRKEDE